MNNQQPSCAGKTWLLVIRKRVRTLAVFGFAFCTLASLGCRQPVANPQASRPLFDFSRSRLFGGGSATRPTASIGGGSIGLGNGSFGGGGFQAPNIGLGQIVGGVQQQQSYIGNQQVPNAAFQQQYASVSNEVQRLNQRLGAYDSDNQLLNTEVAALQQKLQLANQYSQTLKDQLADSSSRIQMTEMEKQAALQQMASMQLRFEQSARMAQARPSQSSSNQGFSNSSSQFGNSNDSQNRFAGYTGGSAPATLAGGATIRANNSLMQKLSQIRIPGGQARMDGDVIRIEFPSDRMFVPGTYQIQPAQLPVLQNIGSTIRQSFPKQIVGIEAHWDGTPLSPPTATDHQLTATQSLAVFENLVRLGLPKAQMFTMAMASNRPRHPQGSVGGVNPNRRIELVIYPETYDGSY